jgi:hypothetical protein
MTEKWMIDVLADLREFAKDNCMGTLVKQLDDTILIAASEMAPLSEPVNIVDHRLDDKPDYLQPAYVV